MADDSAAWLAVIRRIGEERDQAERRLARLLAAVDQAWAMLAERPEEEWADA